MLSLHMESGTEQPSGREALESLWMPAPRVEVLWNLTLTHLVSHLAWQRQLLNDSAGS